MKDEHPKTPRVNLCDCLPHSGLNVCSVLDPTWCGDATTGMWAASTRSHHSQLLQVGHEDGTLALRNLWHYT